MLEKIEDKIKLEVEKIIQKDGITIDEFEILFRYKGILEMERDREKIEIERKNENEKTRQLMTALVATKFN